MSQKVEQTIMEVEKKQPAPVEKKSIKEKKPKEKKPKSDKQAASHPAHPPYFQMIKEALLALNERGGSSPHAIAKYMEEKHKDVLPENYKKMLGVQLKNCVANEKLIKVKASFKLSDASKKQEKKAVPKTKSAKSAPAADEKKTNKRKKPTTSSKPKSTAAVPKSKAAAKKSETTAVAPKKKKTAAPAKKVAATPTKKKTGPAKKVVLGKKAKRATTPVKAKQPKSIKSPAAKRARKTTAA